VLISIITINYNNHLGLECTVESVQNQTYTNFEHIIIDGGSADGSKEYLESQNDKINYWISEPDNGIYNAMNKGIKVAKGEYLFFLNSGDDFVNSKALQSIAQSLSGEDIIYFNINQVSNFRKVKVKQVPSELSFSYLYHDLPPHQSTFIKKKLFNDYGNYDESLKIVADWKFLILALLKYNATYKHIDKVFTNFYLGGVSSNSESFKLMQAEREIVLNKEFPILLNDLKYKYTLERIIRGLRKSKKIQLLIKLGLINKF
jgi:glycosyltransferase involved in cell wall biosynthesis